MLIGILLAQIRSPNIIRVCISYQSDRHIKVCISHQSDCRIRVRISHQSYHSNWKACTNHCVWVFFLLTNDVMESGVVHKGSHLTFFIIWKLKRSFTHNAHAEQLIFHHVPWNQRPKSNQNIPNHCTKWTSGNFTPAWIVFHQSNPFCYISFRPAMSNPTEKDSHGTKC